MKNTNAYHEHNEGLIYATDWFYNKLVKKGTKSSLLACCGKDVHRYERYIDMICTPHKAVGYIMENNKDTYNLIKEQVSNKKVKLKYGDVFNFENTFSKNHPVRVEDIGLGIGIQDMLVLAAGRLCKQKKITNKRIKAQILCGSLRRTSHDTTVEMLKLYISVMKTRILSINNINIKEGGRVLQFGAPVKYYEDPITKWKCQLIKHRVELSHNKRDISMDVFTYMNGGHMLQLMTTFK